LDLKPVVYALFVELVVPTVRKLLGLVVFVEYFLANNTLMAEIL